MKSATEYGVDVKLGHNSQTLVFPSGADNSAHPGPEDDSPEDGRGGGKLSNIPGEKKNEANSGVPSHEVASDGSGSSVICFVYFKIKWRGMFTGT